MLDGQLLEGRQIDSMNYPDQKGKSNCYATDLGNAAKKNCGSNTMTWQHTLETGGVNGESQNWAKLLKRVGSIIRIKLIKRLKLEEKSMSFVGLIKTAIHEQFRNQIKYAQSLCGGLCANDANVRNAMSRLVIWLNHIRNCKNEVGIMQNMKVQTINTFIFYRKSR